MTSADFLQKWGDYLPEGTAVRSMFDVFANSKKKDVNYEVISNIAENLKERDIMDCIRLLLNQNNQVLIDIDKKMYDDGEENDYIPSCCSYEMLLKIIVKNGGKMETFGQKKELRLKKELAVLTEKASKQVNTLKCVLEEMDSIKAKFVIDEIETRKLFIKKIQDFSKEIRNILKQKQKDLLEVVVENSNELEKNNLFKDQK